MKFILSTAFIVMSAITSGQIQNTSWRGIFNVPFPLECAFSFGSDTASLTTTDGELLELMKFRAIGDTLYLQKISGRSTCDSDDEAAYAMKFKENKLFLGSISDDCDIRKDSFPPEGLVKTEQ